MHTLVIAVEGNHPTLRFAAQELARYLRLATGRSLPIVPAAQSPDRAVLLRLVQDTPASEADRIAIDPEGAGYRIRGSNPRSVLFAAYRYLQALGFRWIRPGPNGEIIPRLKSPLARGLRLAETAAYPYRTVCIEGAVSEQHVRDLIDWMAKQGMNGYFIQFDYGTYFWARWYEHQDNPHLKKEPFDARRAQSIVHRVVADIQKRDLRLERVGHGWTCAALGLPGEGWGKFESRISPAKRKFLAQLNGRRDLFHGVPLNSNLCYSNPAVRRAMVTPITAYARAHPEVHAIHLWLADGSNNNCECPRCRKARPADFYVDLLNELDAELSAAGISTRIVFLIYVDLLWPPIRSRLRNPGRFVLMFAPITRLYSESFTGAQRRGRTTPFVLNKLDFPKGAADNIAYLQAWRKQFHGEGFDFDYHLIWACYYDLSMMTIASVLHQDLQGLRKIGLHGFNSCQNQRQSFPHNFAMDVMARTLWNPGLPLARIRKESFADAFGPDGARAESFYSAIAHLWRPIFNPVYTPARDARRIVTGRKNLPAVLALVQQMRPTVQRNLARCKGAVRWSWRYTGIYLDLMERLIPAMEAYLQASPTCSARFQKVFDFLQRREKILHPVLDVSTCVGVLKWRVHEMETYLKNPPQP